METSRKHMQNGGNTCMTEGQKVKSGGFIVLASEHKLLWTFEMVDNVNTGSILWFIQSTEPPMS